MSSDTQHAAIAPTPAVPFDWLPDAELDPHPRLTWLTECAFDVAVDALYEKEEILPKGYKLEGGTLIISNHERDSDVPVLTTTLCQRRGRFIRYPLPFYASREDILRPGFLRELLLVQGWPEIIAWPAGWIPLRWLLQIVRARPMRRVREFTLKEAIGALCKVGLGNEDPRDWLRPSTLAELEKRLRGGVPHTLERLRRKGLGIYGAAFWGLRRLRPTALRRIAPDMRETINTQLKGYANLLDQDRCVYFAPEGTITDDGGMGRIRAGTLRLFKSARRTPRVLPVGLSYDFFNRGRRRVVVNVGTPIEELEPESPRAFNNTLRETLLKLRVATASHLLAQYLSTAPSQFTVEELSEWMNRACKAVVHAGITLDPLLLRTNDMEALVRMRLAWLSHHELVSRAADNIHWENRWSREKAPGKDAAWVNARHLKGAFEDWNQRFPALLDALKI